MKLERESKSERKKEKEKEYMMSHFTRRANVVHFQILECLWTRIVEQSAGRWNRAFVFQATTEQTVR